MDRSQQTQLLATAVRDRCGPPATWEPRSANYGYLDGLALCVIDAIQSTGVRYGGVRSVIARYRDYRGSAAETDGAPELLATFADLGEDAWATRIGTRNKISTHPGAPLKAHAIHRAAEALVALGVDTCMQFRGQATDITVRQAWTSLPGQSSAITWHYINMLAGTEGVKPDRMIRRFTAAALAVPSRTLSDDDLIDLVTDAAAALDVSATALDHVIWLAQSGRLNGAVLKAAAEA